MNNSGEKPKVLLPLYLCQETAPCFCGKLTWRLHNPNQQTSAMLDVSFQCHFSAFHKTWFGSWFGHVPPCIRNPWPFASLFFLSTKWGENTDLLSTFHKDSTGLHENPITVQPEAGAQLEFLLSALLPLLTLQIVDIHNSSLESKCPWWPLFSVSF